MKATHLKLVRQGETDPPGAWLLHLEQRFAPPERELLHAAASFASERSEGRALPSGEPALNHAVGAAGVLLDLRLDAEALVASILAPVAALAPRSAAAIRERFGAAVAELVDGVVRMAQLGALSMRPPVEPKPEQHAAQLEALR